MSEKKITALRYAAGRTGRTLSSKGWRKLKRWYAGLPRASRRSPDVDGFVAVMVRDDVKRAHAILAARKRAAEAKAALERSRKGRVMSRGAVQSLLSALGSVAAGLASPFKRRR